MRLNLHSSLYPDVKCCCTDGEGTGAEFGCGKANRSRLGTDFGRSDVAVS
jgi:hypothetical protein